MVWCSVVWCGVVWCGVQPAVVRCGGCQHPPNELMNGCTTSKSQPSSPSLQVWVKPSAEMSFLYGNHVLKSGVGKVSEGLPANTGVVVLSMANIPLGFGVSVKTTSEIRTLDPSAIVVLHQADIGREGLWQGASAAAWGMGVLVYSTFCIVAAPACQLNPPAVCPNPLMPT